MPNQTQASRGIALRAGWNDAAWGKSRHGVDTALVPWYARGYAGGLIYRQKQAHDTSEQDLWGPVPQLVR